MAENKWHVLYGVHRGTLTSRDTSSVDFATEAHALAYYNDMVAGYQPGKDPFGCLLWFAELRDPENNVIRKESGYPYSR